MGHHSTLIGGGKGEGCLFCSNAHKIVASVVNVLTRIVAPSSLGLYEKLRQYFPVQTSHSVNKSLLYTSCEREAEFVFLQSAIFLQKYKI